MKIVPKAKMAFCLGLVSVGVLTAFGQTDAGVNSQTTNYGGSRPAGSGIKPSTPNEGGTAWMADTNRSSESNLAPAVGGTSPGSSGGSGEASRVVLNNLGWLGLFGLAGLLSLLARPFERPATVKR